MKGPRNSHALSTAIGESDDLRMSYSSGVANEADIGLWLEAHSRGIESMIYDGDLRTRGPIATISHSHSEVAICALFGSAGQQRTAAIALRMLEVATLRTSRDDVARCSFSMIRSPNST